MVFGWGESDDAHRQVYGGEQHESHFSHELIAGAASFEGMKLWEDHQRKEGKPVSHSFAKEAIAGLVGAEVDKLAETKGMDEVDRLKAREHAKRNAEHMYDEHYVRGQGADQYDPQRYGRHERQERRGCFSSALLRNNCPEVREKSDRAAFANPSSPMRSAGHIPAFQSRCRPRHLRGLVGSNSGGANTPAIAIETEAWQTPARHELIAARARPEALIASIRTSASTGELEHELVPEWRAKYLDYKTGKKKVKALTRALQKAQRSPYTPSLRAPTPAAQGAPRPDNLAPSNSNKPLDRPRSNTNSRSTPNPRAERQPLRTRKSRPSPHVGNRSYGSIIATPPLHGQGSDAESFELPDPALDPEEEYGPPEGDAGLSNKVKTPSPILPRRATFGDLPARDESAARRPSLTQQHLLRRVFSNAEGASPGKRTQYNYHPDVEKREDEFFAFLDSELSKVDSFYEMKEEEALQRLQVLRQQLHIMRDQRIQEFMAAKRAAKDDEAEMQARSNGFGKFNDRLKDTLTGKPRFGKNSEALAEMATPGLHGRNHDFIVNRRDFMRRHDPHSHEVSYRTAKKKLKHALQEFYRGVELLKGYAYLNRTAFRKINKKYDKAVNARPPLRYMSEKINKASFVQSETLESLMVTAEDLYARYFERGNRKIAVSKLRHTIMKSGDYSPSTFRAGLMLMAGALFAIQGLVYAAQHLSSGDSEIHTRTSYLLQIYGGYFLVTFHVLLFCVDCMIWTKSKINYAFVFEYDTRHTLESRQLLEIPSFFFCLMGLCMWLNFSWTNAMYIYWPVVLIGITVIFIFLPARILYHRSRKWWAFSNWRLLLAGIYPVEFRDFFLGDMYCSQTYAMGNIALFFCLYSVHWNNAAQCNSSHSRLLGFFTCLPSVWRAFQCIRRYVDTKNAFPHLLNLGKYIFGVLYYATLSMYRIDRDKRYQASFITFALLNAVYTSVWDLIMDWSLGNPYSKHPLLREVLAFRKAWIYYAAMVVDVVVRFNWIFYAIFTHEIQHSAVLSFVVSFTEVCRRGIWSIFRVENEHCTNVLLFRASRDVPLPYEASAPVRVTPAVDGGESPEDMQLQEQPVDATPFLPPEDIEHGTPSGTSPRARHRRPSAGVVRVGTALASAHAQDFQRRRLPTYFSSTTVAHRGLDRSTDDTSDEDEALDDMTDEDLGLTADGTHHDQHAE
ncbi:SPX N-terminal [Penicillium lagena]|uniref:SPX N-terminal n=1 Tax=Penicillium lagena TaxID=94218 RepID=UPI002540280A|nr:SPX N-terminal [Penicillium lagena]KAJ5620776.1 SPX N-terminal [Penicillium lagena]